MNASTDSPTPPRRRSPFNRMTLLAFVAGATLAGGLTALAGGAGMGGWHSGLMLHGTPTAADISAHVDHALKHLYVEIDATDAQKAQIAPLVKQAVNDLLPLRTQLQSAHAQAVDVLTQPNIDRTALEATRAAHLQLADQASKRITALLADVGDVLTPTQRTTLAARLQHMHGKAGSGE